jgi:hypothetical protein
MYPHEQFAGHEFGIALAQMSFKTEHLDDVAGCASLGGWIQKFKFYRCYPVEGRLIPTSDLPDPTHIVSKEELEKNNGEGEVPDKYATAPIYIGAGGKLGNYD